MLKMVIVIREDLGLSPGKAVAQGAHAAIGASDRVRKSVIDEWASTGTTKIVLGCKDLVELNNCIAKAAKLGINVYYVTDAGRTEIPSGTITCCAIGPADEKLVNKVTGNLPLYKGST